MFQVIQFRGKSHLLCLLALIGGFAPAAHAEYKLGSGDVIEVSVFKVPELTKRATVDIDGRVAVPSLGSVDASGSTLQELGERIHAFLVSRGVAIDPQVSIALVEARPFFISGDVGKPGSYPYQLGLTVRHAIALAGGFSLSRSRGETGSPSQAVDLRSQEAIIWTELIRQRARVARLKADLEGRNNLDLPSFEDAPIPPQTVAEIVRLELEQLKAQKEELSNEHLHLKRVLDQLQERIAALSQQKAFEEEGLRQQLKEVQTVSGLKDQGLVANPRAAQEQRTLLFMRTGVAETTAHIALAQREIEIMKRRLQNLEEKRQITLNSSLQDAIVGIDKTQSQLKAVVEKMLHIGVARPVEEPQIIIFRREGKKRVQLIAGQDDDILPGDVIEANYAVTAGNASGLADRSFANVQGVRPIVAESQRPK
ncbi:polysaccharide biosynthesis/export family protein [Microvirga aerilata]|uniref:Polysaccharide biosynthesis/export family protein n=1 Tax=Microvirga aerilata TaxID=670292 RepID=A0A936ZCJ6_9HYPH|nr:polysaccharide biosynthesis/export family protein [Microvirga aerilata]MBL0407662.1 polysaccharide biosynthesis/export family protein [Microvirga aerilata]